MCYLITAHIICTNTDNHIVEIEKGRCEINIDALSEPDNDILYRTTEYELVGIPA